MKKFDEQIIGYQITEQIYEGHRTRVYRGCRESDQTPVILKILKSKYPSFNELVLFRNQYTITKNLELPGVISPIALEAYHHGYMLVMLDQGCISLQQYISNIKAQLEPTQPAQFPLDQFWAIAIQIVKILEGLYQKRIIHKDIKPENILIHPATETIYLIDFSIASLLPKETQEIQNPNHIEGTLAYIASLNELQRLTSCDIIKFERKFSEIIC